MQLVSGLINSSFVITVYYEDKHMGISVIMSPQRPNLSKKKIQNLILYYLHQNDETLYILSLLFVL